MNRTMRQDVSDALRQRVRSSIESFSETLTVSGATEDPAAFESQAAQLEADMDRFRQLFRFLRRERFDEAYNMLDMVGKAPDEVAEEPVETPPELVETPITP